MFGGGLGRADAVYGCCCQLPMGLSDPSGCKSIYLSNLTFSDTAQHAANACGSSRKHFISTRRPLLADTSQNAWCRLQLHLDTVAASQSRSNRTVHTQPAQATVISFAWQTQDQARKLKYKALRSQSNPCTRRAVKHRAG